MEQKVYKTLSDDFFDDGKEHKVPQNYPWIPRGAWSRLKCGVSYALALTVGFVYCRCFLHMRIRGREKLKGCRGGFFLYGNHTQPVGDVVIPAFVCFPRRIYTVVSPANLDLPVIGKILPYLGALPIAQDISGMKQFLSAVDTRTQAGHPVVVYPEGHVWPYYTGIRPFGSSAFKFPDRQGLPAFAMTVTYGKRRWGKKPRMTVYLEGPFYPEGQKGPSRAASLCEQIRRTMENRARESTCAYISYVQQDCKENKPML